MTTKQLVVKTLKVIEDVIDGNGEKNVGICEGPANTTVYILGNNIYKSPFEFYQDKTKTMFGLLFYDTLKMENWSMTTRQPDHGYFINDGKFYSGTNAVTPVPTTQVLKELKSTCEMWKTMNNISKGWDQEGGMSIGRALKNM